MKTRTLQAAISVALFATVIVAPAPTLAQAAAQSAEPDGDSANYEWHFDLPAGELSASLEAFTAQSGVRAGYSHGLTAGKRAPAISGRMGWPEALATLLDGSGLTFRQIEGGSVAVVPAEAGATSAGTPHGVSRMEGSASSATNFDTITVTGTRIRGGESPSPVIAIGSERIRDEGFADLGEVIRSVPQNFTGGQNPGVASLGISGGGLQNQNLNGGSSLNLRGLGPDASLTLLNGRRMAYGGLAQSVDISAIPVDAVDRIEIIADGSSAIYGADAVGGVGNVILKRDYDGVSLGARYGAATEGGQGTTEYTATAGTVWSSGGFISTYRYASIDPIYTRTRDYASHLPYPMTLYPGSDEKSLLISAHQSLGDAAEVRVDAFQNLRDQVYNLHAGNGLNVRAEPYNKATFVSPSVVVWLPGDWTLTAGGTWGKGTLEQKQKFEMIATGSVVAALEQCICHESRTFEVGAEGPLLELPAGDLRLAVGAGYRANEYLQRDVLRDFTYAQGEDSSRFGYAELHLPVMGPQSNNAQRLDVVAAIRREEHDGFGGVTTPKLGVIYSPGSDVTFKASWGKSFKAPTLHQRYYYLWLTLDPASFWGGVDAPDGATALAVGGGDPDLRPERARSWTASMVIHPESVQGLEAELSWFDVDYEDRVIEPLVRFDQVLRDPIYDRFVVRSPTQGEQDELLSSGADLINRTGSAYDPDDVVALIFNHYVNVSRQRIRGVDAAATYRKDLASGWIAWRGSASWLDSNQETVPGERRIDLAGTLNNPPRLVGRTGVVWNRGVLTTSIFANYKAGIRNDIEQEKTASFTTFDMTLRYATDPGRGAWSGLELALSAQNLLDRPPPLHTAWHPYAPPYDTTNYSPVGRFISASVSKRW